MFIFVAKSLLNFTKEKTMPKNNFDQLLANTDEDFMRRCFALAKLGEGQVAPNPMVGAVITYENRIIGEGYHREYGTGPQSLITARNEAAPAAASRSRIPATAARPAARGSTH